MTINGLMRARRELSLLWYEAIRTSAAIGWVKLDTDKSWKTGHSQEERENPNCDIRLRADFFFSIKIKASAIDPIVS